MKDYFRQSMAWLHTWVGLLLGWVLYFMFITGTVGYLDTEIDRWMKPELPVSELALPAPEISRIGRAYLEQHASEANRWSINFALDRNNPFPRVSWRGEKGEGGDAQLDPSTGAALVGRDTAGGQMLYRMHWKLHYLPEVISDWLVGIATMFMLIALVTGVIVHKKIFADFFTFRPGKGQRSWLDAHNVVSVFSLPFQLMITYSGLIFMMFTYMPLIVAAFYGSDPAGRKAFRTEAFEPPAMVSAAERLAPLAPLEPLIASAIRHWEGAPVSSLEIRHPGDANARIVIYGRVSGGPLRAADLLVFDGVSGELLAERRARHLAAKTFRDVMLGLHEGLFAGPVLRFLYVFSGLLGAAMIATGLVLWAIKRRQRSEKAGEAPHFGLRLVERLNVATIIGLPLAIAAYFWANRLLPLDMADRAAWEVNCLFLAWLLLFLHAALRPVSRAWQEQAWLAGAVFTLLPLLNALTTSRHLGHSLPEGDWVMAGFDLSMLGVGLAFAAFASYLGRRACALPESTLAASKVSASPAGQA